MMNSTELYRRQDAAPMLGGTSKPSTQYLSSEQTAIEHRSQDLLDATMLDALSTHLREPLAVIKGAAETLLCREQRLSSQERHEFLSAIMEASERFEGVLRRMLPSNT